MVTGGETTERPLGSFVERLGALENPTNNPDIVAGCTQQLIAQPHIAHQEISPVRDSRYESGKLSRGRRTAAGGAGRVSLGSFNHGHDGPGEELAIAWTESTRPAVFSLQKAHDSVDGGIFLWQVLATVASERRRTR